MWILFALGNAVAFGLGAYLFQNKVITIGTVYIIFQYTTMLQRPIEELSRQVEDLQRAGASVTRVQELLNIRSKLLGYSPASSLSIPEQSMIEKTGSTGALEVQFEDVSFGYHDGLVNDTSEMVLHNLSFHIAPCKVVGLLGRTGSGKTSLTRLLFRLYDPDHGVIRIAQHNIHPMYREISFPAPRGGDKGVGDVIHPPVDIRQISLDQLRQQIGMITQNIQLFNASVRDNLTFFDDRIPDDRILSAIRDIGLWRWYCSLPEGLDTELESGGGGLSAGEAQLLAFTRIFLKDPGLVILDEASSRLDPATENMINSAVERLVHNRTAIIVAHRLGTVQRADEIMILEDGRVCEYGPRLRLANDPDSHFSRLLQTGLEEVLV
jgi:ATP-binding cassette subfamily B protein